MLISFASYTAVWSPINPRNVKLSLNAKQNQEKRVERLLQYVLKTWQCPFKGTVCHQISDYVLYIKLNFVRTAYDVFIFILFVVLKSFQNNRKEFLWNHWLIPLILLKESCKCNHYIIFWKSLVKILKGFRSPFKANKVKFTYNNHKQLHTRWRFKELVNQKIQYLSKLSL